MEALLGSEYFGTILGCYDSFILDDSEVTIKFYPNEEEYQGLLDFPEIYYIIYHSYEERAVNSYGQYIGSEVVLPDWKGKNS